jgi:hypothetical protein
MRCIVQLILLHLKKKGNFKHDMRPPFSACKTHTLSCKMQIMLQISSMVLLQSTTTDEARFNDEHEMSVDDGLHGWTEDRNWWVRLMTWRRCRWGHQMTWTSKAWGPVVGPVFGHGRRESGVRWWGPSR